MDQSNDHVAVLFTANDFQEDTPETHQPSSSPSRPAESTRRALPEDEAVSDRVSSSSDEPLTFEESGLPRNGMFLDRLVWSQDRWSSVIVPPDSTTLV